LKNKVGSLEFYFLMCSHCSPVCPWIPILCKPDCSVHTSTDKIIKCLLSF